MPHWANTRVLLGLYGDDGEENGNNHHGLYRVLGFRALGFQGFGLWLGIHPVNVRGRN